MATQEFWLKGRGSAFEWFPVVAKNMRGVVSPGIFSGQYFRDDREKPEYCKACGGTGMLMRHDAFDDWMDCPICKGQHAGEPSHGWTKWSYWCDWWKVGDDVAAYLGIIPDLEAL